MALAADVPRIETRSWWHRNQQTVAPWLFLAPGMLFFLVYVIFPVFQSFNISLYDWDGLGEPTFIGLQNYENLYREWVDRDAFYTALGNNLIWLIMYLLAIPVPLPPRIPGLDVTVTRVESLPPAASLPLRGGGAVRHWLEHLEGHADVREVTTNGDPILMSQGNVHYLGAWLDDEGFDQLVCRTCASAGIETTSLSDGLRIRDTATHRFVFNYAPEPLTYDGIDIPPPGFTGSRCETRNHRLWHKRPLTSRRIGQRLDFRARAIQTQSIKCWDRTSRLPVQANNNRCGPIFLKEFTVSVTVSLINMKGGVGKTTLAFNLAWYAAWKVNLRVLVVDLDPSQISVNILWARRNIWNTLMLANPRLLKFLSSFLRRKQEVVLPPLRNLAMLSIT